MATSGYRKITALFLGLRSRESGQLSTIIPQNNGITITYVIARAGVVFGIYFTSCRYSGD